MDIKRFTVIIALGLATAGCYHRNVIVEPQVQDSNIMLAEAAQTVGHSITDVDEIQRATTSPLAIRPLPDPDAYGMDSLASIDWAGPVGPVVAKIATATGYRLRVLGNPPAIPVLIQITERNQPLGYILRDVDFQCRGKANIVVYPESRVIELQYAGS